MGYSFKYFWMLEPLLRRIWANQSIKGVLVGSVEHKLSAYADNILFHVMDPLVSLPNLLEELTAYGQVSNFRINYAKSEILPIDVPPALATTLKRAFTFTWASTFIKYLGIQLTDCLDSLYTHNYAPLLRKIRQGLQSWDRATFTWIGHTNIIKITILPCILFILQMVPVSLPRCFFTELRSLFTLFVWKGK